MCCRCILEFGCCNFLGSVELIYCAVCLTDLEDCSMAGPEVALLD